LNGFSGFRARRFQPELEFLTAWVVQDVAQVDGELESFVDASERGETRNAHVRDLLRVGKRPIELVQYDKGLGGVSLPVNSDCFAVLPSDFCQVHADSSLNENSERASGLLAAIWRKSGQKAADVIVPRSATPQAVPVPVLPSR